MHRLSLQNAFGSVKQRQHKSISGDGMETAPDDPFVRKRGGVIQTYFNLGAGSYGFDI